MGDVVPVAGFHRLRAGQRTRRGGEVDALHQLVSDVAGGKAARPAPDVRHPGDGVGADSRRLLHDPELGGVVAVVRGVDHDGVLRQTCLVEELQELAHGVVDVADVAQVAVQLAQAPGGEGPGLEQLPVGGAPALHGGLQVRGLAVQIVVCVGRQGEGPCNGSARARVPSARTRAPGPARHVVPLSDRAHSHGWRSISRFINRGSSLMYQNKPFQALPPLDGVPESRLRWTSEEGCQ